MGSDEIMPELLRQQNAGSPGEGGWRELCHAGKAVRSPPSSVTLTAGPGGEFQRPGSAAESGNEVCPGWHCVLVGKDLLGSWSWGHFWGAWRGGHPACAGGSGCPWERC